MGCSRVGASNAAAARTIAKRLGPAIVGAGVRTRACWACACACACVRPGCRLQCCCALPCLPCTTVCCAVLCCAVLPSVAVCPARVPVRPGYMEAKTPQQTNGYDCGMFTVALMELLSAAPALPLPDFDTLAAALTPAAVAARRTALAELVHLLAREHVRT